jgi:hypothetical protein
MPRLMHQLYRRTRQLVPATAAAVNASSPRPHSRRCLNA